MNESSTQTIVFRKALRINMSDMLADSQYRREVISRLQANDDYKIRFKRALKLLRNVLQAAEANPATAIEVADEISVILIKEDTAKSLRAALHYLELANKLERETNPNSALVAARKALIGVVLVRLPHYLNGKGNVPLGQALRAKAEKSLKHCDISQIDLARLMTLLACIQSLTDDEGLTGHAGTAAEALFIRPNWSAASITNMINGVTNPNYKEWMDTKAEEADPSDNFKDRHSD